CVPRASSLSGIERFAATASPAKNERFGLRSQQPGGLARPVARTQSMLAAGWAYFGAEPAAIACPFGRHALCFRSQLGVVRGARRPGAERPPQGTIIRTGTPAETWSW